MSETRTEWAARYHRYDGTSTIHPAFGDRVHAEMLADGKMSHLVTLNEPTRREGGVESVWVVSREVTVADDYTKTIGPWQAARPGRVWA
ncbi:hypothetical protein GCM10010172_07530 [Paractinoplanes ferrugineus]|uniref:Uncharacterized protein n=1 Tax=Paractinoplanes ferrugineus TaxID=113564 RepID=A0A919J8L6_9ACTN|nr:hypothetical protein [Actinoplanes ferrugineus]GIE16856.1 hypothetical protein Afe05nite_86960 [Actinoplanes ferrugineus]